MPTRPSGLSTQPNQPRSVALAARLWLYFVYPRELAGRRVELTYGLTVGREPAENAPATGSATHAAVPHPTVSRRHADVKLAAGVPVLTDLGSSNGTRVDGRMILHPTALVAQSVVRLGDTIAVVEEHAPDESDDGTSPIPGTGPHMARVRTLLARAAPESGAALIMGETGTGKEWLAAEFHRLSGRRGPYLKLSCADLSPQVMESELFGHERGAFTGAVARHVGLFQAAHLGTLFLDEIGELPLELQAKLLRVLQEGEVRPIGSVQSYATDARVVAATNRDLPALVDGGRFRRDLYARLAVFEIVLPPLRLRRQDILGWLDRMWEGACKERGKSFALSVQPAVAERIVTHDWPDNLRGLHRLVQRLLSIGEDVALGARLLGEVMPELAQEDAPAPGPEPVPAQAKPRPMATTAPPAASEPPTRDEFLAVYEATGRSVRATSKHFGRDRRQIYRWLEAFGIERPPRGSSPS